MSSPVDEDLEAGPPAMPRRTHPKRRSSILKIPAQLPMGSERGALQDLDPNSPTGAHRAVSTQSRRSSKRVSFSASKTIKEFETGSQTLTVWNSTYEEDYSLVQVGGPEHTQGPSGATKRKSDLPTGVADESAVKRAPERAAGGKENRSQIESSLHLLRTLSGAADGSEAHLDLITDLNTSLNQVIGSPADGSGSEAAASPAWGEQSMRVAEGDDVEDAMDMTRGVMGPTRPGLDTTTSAMDLTRAAGWCPPRSTTLDRTFGLDLTHGTNGSDLTMDLTEVANASALSTTSKFADGFLQGLSSPAGLADGEETQAIEMTKSVSKAYLQRLEPRSRSGHSWSLDETADFAGRSDLSSALQFLKELETKAPTIGVSSPVQFPVTSGSVGAMGESEPQPMNGLSFPEDATERVPAGMELTVPVPRVGPFRPLNEPPIESDTRRRTIAEATERVPLAMDMTEPVSMALGAQHKFKAYNDATERMPFGMEMTEPVALEEHTLTSNLSTRPMRLADSVKPSESDSVSQTLINEGATERVPFGMEIPEPVPQAFKIRVTQSESIDEVSVQEHATATDEEIDATKRVPFGVEMTEPIPQAFRERGNQPESKRPEVEHDNVTERVPFGMEMTEPIPQAFRERGNQPESKRPEVEHDNVTERVPFGMEMTEPIPQTFRAQADQSELTDQVTAQENVTERVPFGMEMIEPVPRSFRDHDNQAKSKRPEDEHDNVTERVPFGMEMTEPIPQAFRAQPDQSESTDRVTAQENATERVPFGMEMTEPVPRSVRDHDNQPESKRPEDEHDNVTERVPFGMEMTEPIPQAFRAQPDQSESTDRVTAQENATERVPFGMEMTEPVPRSVRDHDNQAESKRPEDEHDNVTERVPFGMEMTEPIPQAFRAQADKSESTDRVTAQENATERVPFGMEMTEPVPRSVRDHDNQAESKRPEDEHDNVTERVPFGMEMTEPIPQAFRAQADKSESTDRVTAQENATERVPIGIEMTEPVPRGFRDTVPESTKEVVNPTERVPFGMEMTEPVPNARAGKKIVKNIEITDVNAPSSKIEDVLARAMLGIEPAKANPGLSQNDSIPKRSLSASTTERVKGPHLKSPQNLTEIGAQEDVPHNVPANGSPSDVAVPCGLELIEPVPEMFQDRLIAENDITGDTRTIGDRVSNEDPQEADSTNHPNTSPHNGVATEEVLDKDDIELSQPSGALKNHLHIETSVRFWQESSGKKGNIIEEKLDFVMDFESSASDPTLSHHPHMLTSDQALGSSQNFPTGCMDGLRETNRLLRELASGPAISALDETQLLVSSLAERDESLDLGPRIVELSSLSEVKAEEPCPTPMEANASLKPHASDSGLETGEKSNPPKIPKVAPPSPPRRRKISIFESLTRETRKSPEFLTSHGRWQVENVTDWRAKLSFLHQTLVLNISLGYSLPVDEGSDPLLSIKHWTIGSIEFQNPTLTQMCSNGDPILKLVHRLVLRQLPPATLLKMCPSTLHLEDTLQRIQSLVSSGAQFLLDLEGIDAAHFFFGIHGLKVTVGFLRPHLSFYASVNFGQFEALGQSIEIARDHGEVDEKSLKYLGQSIARKADASPWEFLPAFVRQVEDYLDVGGSTSS